MLPELFALWTDHLWDNIPTVREDTAVALARAVAAYGDEAAGRVLAALRWGPGAFRARARWRFQGRKGGAAASPVLLLAARGRFIAVLLPCCTDSAHRRWIRPPRAWV